MLRLLGALQAGGRCGSAGGPGGCSGRAASALWCPKCTRTSAALGSGDPAHVHPDGTAGRAPSPPLLLLQGPVVAEYLQQEYGHGIILRKWRAWLLVTFTPLPQGAGGPSCGVALH